MINSKGEFEPIRPMNGRRVAVLLHGLGSDKSCMAPLGQWLASQTFRAKKKSWGYDAVMVYEYDTYGPTVDEMVERFGRSFYDVVDRASPPRVDGFGVSLGGVILRAAAKFHGVGDAMRRITTFSSFGEGIPAKVLEHMADLVNIYDPRLKNSPVFADLAEGSAFMARLTKTPSPYRRRTILHTFGGTCHRTYIPFPAPIPNPISSSGPQLRSGGEVMDAILASYHGSQVPNDGLIPLSSVQSPTLRLDSDFWGARPESRIVGDFDHVSIIGAIYNPLMSDESERIMALPLWTIAKLPDVITRKLR